MTLDDSEAATRLAHTLKGVAGNIGATGIQRTAEALELACIKGQVDIEELLQTVNDELKMVINSLVALESTGDSITTAKVATQQIDNKQVDNLLSRLRELLEDDDADATETIDELDELPTTAADQALLKQLSRTVSEYDFEAALKVLGELEASRSTNE